MNQRLALRDRTAALFADTLQFDSATGSPVAPMFADLPNEFGDYAEEEEYSIAYEALVDLLWLQVALTDDQVTEALTILNNPSLEIIDWTGEGMPVVGGALNEDEL